jgi:hypothetical protein
MREILAMSERKGKQRIRDSSYNLVKQLLSTQLSQANFPALVHIESSF